MKHLQTWVAVSAVVAVMGVAGVAGAATLDLSPAQTQLNVTVSGSLPTSPLYFVKELTRKVRLWFTSSDTAKAQLELQFSDEKLAEALKVNEQDANNQDAFEKALDNYRKAQESLTARLGKLKESSNNPNVETLIKNIDERMKVHTEVITEIQDEAFKKEFDKSSPLLVKTVEARQKIDATVSASAEKDEVKKERAQEQITKAKKSLTDLEARLRNLGVLAIMQSGSCADACVFAYVGDTAKINQCKGEVCDDGNNDSSDSRQKAWLPANFRFTASKLANATEQLKKAQEAFDNGQYGAAYGLAVSADLDRDGSLDRIMKIESFTIKQSIKSDTRDMDSDDDGVNANDDADGRDDSKSNSGSSTNSGSGSTSSGSSKSSGEINAEVEIESGR